MKECNLPQWEAAKCPKLGSTFERVVEQVSKIEFLLKHWMQEPNLRHDQWTRISDVWSMVNEIPPMLGDLGFPYEVMQVNRGLLEERKVLAELPDEVIRQACEAVFGAPHDAIERRAQAKG